MQTICSDNFNIFLPNFSDLEQIFYRLGCLNISDSKDKTEFLYP